MDGPVPMTPIARVERAFLAAVAVAASNEFAVQLMGLFAAPPKVKHAKKSARNVIVILAQKSMLMKIGKYPSLCHINPN